MNSSKLSSLFPEALIDAPLAPHTTFGVGGRALGYLLVKTAEEFSAAVAQATAAQIPFRIIAGGSNIVFCDDDYQGLVIQWQSGAAGISEAGERELVAEAGASLGDVIKFALARGWAGLESLSGIPGTVGGAVVGNAGAYGHSISECIKEVEILDLAKLEKAPRSISREGAHFAYRDSIFKHQPWLVLRVKVEFQPGDAAALTQISAEIIATREKKYRPGLACPGSFFKNILVSETTPEILQKIDQSKIIEGKIPAGYLLEQVGAKGLKTEHLEIASFHGNLIINRGGATYEEVKKLADSLKEKVKLKFGLELEEEVRYIL